MSTAGPSQGDDMPQPQHSASLKDRLESLRSDLRADPIVCPACGSAEALANEGTPVEAVVRAWRHPHLASSPPSPRHRRRWHREAQDAARRAMPVLGAALDRLCAEEGDRRDAVDRMEGVVGVLLAALHVALDSDDIDAREGARCALQEVRDSDIATSTEDRHEVRAWLARGEGK